MHRVYYKHLFAVQLLTAVFISELESISVTLRDANGSIISSLVVREDETFSLACTSQNTRNTLSLSCDSAITQYLDKGIGNVLKVMATRDMNGKHCMCSYTESKQRVFSTALKIYVLYAAHVTRFEMTNSIGTPIKQATVQSEVIKISCISSGNPAPFIQLFRENEFGDRIVLKSVISAMLLNFL